MEEILALLLAVVITAVPFLLMAATFLVPTLMLVLAFGGFAYLLIRANNPNPEKQLPKMLQRYVEHRPRQVKGFDPQQSVWQDAGEVLGLAFTPPTETWTSYGSCRLEGEVDGFAVRVDVREWGNLRYTRTQVAVTSGTVLPDTVDPVLTRKTKQGAAFVSHAPTLEIKDGELMHEAIGIRDDPAEMASVVRALVRIARNDPPGLSES